MKRSLGTTLLATGALICVLGALGLTLGMFVTIPESVARAVVRAAGFSAPFLVGGALMLAGAAVRRASRVVDASVALEEARPGALASGSAASAAAGNASAPSSREKVPVSRAGSRAT